MKPWYGQSVFLSLLLVLYTPTAWPDSYRCGRKLVRTGDSTGDLLRVCGEPLHKDRGFERVRIDGKIREQRVERWYYRKNKRSLQRVVLVHGGLIIGIEVEGR